MVNRARELNAQGPCHRGAVCLTQANFVKRSIVTILGPTPSWLAHAVLQRLCKTR